MDYKVTTLKCAVSYRDSNPIFGENTTHIEINDDGDGAFLVLSQEENKLRIDPDELILITETAKKMIAEHDGVTAEMQALEHSERHDEP